MEGKDRLVAALGYISPVLGVLIHHFSGKKGIRRHAYQAVMLNFLLSLFYTFTAVFLIITGEMGYAPTVAAVLTLVLLVLFFLTLLGKDVYIIGEKWDKDTFSAASAYLAGVFSAVMILKGSEPVKKHAFRASILGLAVMVLQGVGRALLPTSILMGDLGLYFDVLGVLSMGIALGILALALTVLSWLLFVYVLIRGP